MCLAMGSVHGSSSGTHWQAAAAFCGEYGGYQNYGSLQGTLNQERTMILTPPQYIPNRQSEVSEDGGGGLENPSNMGISTVSCWFSWCRRFFSREHCPTQIFLLMCQTCWVFLVKNRRNSRSGTRHDQKASL